MACFSRLVSNPILAVVTFLAIGLVTPMTWAGDEPDGETRDECENWIGN